MKEKREKEAPILLFYYVQLCGNFSKYRTLWPDYLVTDDGVLFYLRLEFTFNFLWGGDFVTRLLGYGWHWKLFSLLVVFLKCVVICCCFFLVVYWHFYGITIPTYVCRSNFSIRINIELNHHFPVFMALKGDRYLLPVPYLLLMLFFMFDRKNK